MAPGKLPLVWLFALLLQTPGSCLASRRLSFEQYYANKPDSEFVIMKAYLISAIVMAILARMTWTCCCDENVRNTLVTLVVGAVLVLIVALTF